MTTSTQETTATDPGTYELTSNDWNPWAGRAETDFPLADVLLAMQISHERGVLEATVADRPGDGDAKLLPVLRIRMPADGWVERQPRLFALLGELWRGPASGHSAIEPVRALLDELGFVCTSPFA